MFFVAVFFRFLLSGFYLLFKLYCPGKQHDITISAAKTMLKMLFLFPRWDMFAMFDKTWGSEQKEQFHVNLQ